MKKIDAMHRKKLKNLTRQIIAILNESDLHFNDHCAVLGSVFGCICTEIDDNATFLSFFASLMNTYYANCGPKLTFATSIDLREEEEEK